MNKFTKLNDPAFEAKVILITNWVNVSFLEKYFNKKKNQLFYVKHEINAKIVNKIK